ncbi:MAG: ABC transporter ATP-binding protein [Prevotella sp.]|nr:ABC transporter ATP-binding protein [Prevotella sp.]
MMLELHNVTIGQLIHSLSLTVGDGQLVGISGSQGSGKTTLLRAVLGLIPIDAGHISIDGELLTPKSAPYFRRQMAYVPQHLSVPEGYNKLDANYLSLLRRAVESDKSLLIVDEPPQPVSEDDLQTIDQLLRHATQRGATVLAVNSRIMQNQVRL